MIGASTKVATAVWVGNVTGATRTCARLDFDSGAARRRVTASGPRSWTVADNKYGGDEFPEPDPSAFKQVLVDIPQVVGLSLEAAKQAIEAAGFGRRGRRGRQRPARGHGRGHRPVGQAGRGTTIRVSSSNGNGDGLPRRAGMNRRPARPRSTRPGSQVRRSEHRTSDRTASTRAEPRPGAAAKPGDDHGHRRQARRTAVGGNAQGNDVEHAARLACARIATDRRGGRSPAAPGDRSSSAPAGRCARRGARAARGAEPIRVLHLSDLHMAPWQRSSRSGCARRRLKPDLIVNTGDNLGHERGIEGIRRAFDPFRGVPGVFVNGSNDYFGPDLKNPFMYFGGPSRHIASARSPRHRRAARVLRRPRLARPRQHGGEPRPPRHAFRVLRRRRPAQGLRPPRPHHRGDRRAAADDPLGDELARRGIRDGTPAHRHGRRHARALPARAQLVREPRRAARARRAHARRPGVRAGVRRARHQLRHPALAGQGAQRVAARAAYGVPQRLGGSRHVDLRAGALRVPARGHAADPRPAARPRGSDRDARWSGGPGFIGYPC